MIEIRYIKSTKVEQADSELRVLLGLPSSSSPLYSGADIKARNHIWLSKLMQQKYFQTDVVVVLQ